jgi:hypothetical protein
MANKISYSQYSMWANCGHAWKLKYVDGHKIDDTSIATIFGTSMHEVIQDWLDTLYNKSETIAKSVYLHDTLKEKLLTLFKEHVVVDEGGNKTFLCDKKTLMEHYEQGCKILDYVQQNYKKLFPTSNTKLFGIEYELNAEIKKGVNYVGYIDIVTFNEITGKYVLYDLKTSRMGWTQDQKSDPSKVGQLLLYKTFFAQQEGVAIENISVEFVILKRVISENSPYPIPRVSKFEPPNKTPSLNKNWDRFQLFVDTAFDDEGNYITEQAPKPSKEACRWCKFRDKPDLCSVAVRK